MAPDQCGCRLPHAWLQRGMESVRSHFVMQWPRAQILIEPAAAQKVKGKDESRADLVASLDTQAHMSHAPVIHHNSGACEQRGKSRPPPDELSKSYSE